MTLRTRIGVVAAAAVAVAVVVVALGTFAVARRELRSEIDHSLLERMRLARTAGGELRPFLTAAIVGFPGRRGGQFDDVYYRLTLPDGEVIAPPNQAVALPPPDGDLGREPRLRDARIDGVHLRIVEAAVEPVGVLTMARPLDEVDRALGGLAVALFTIGGIGSLLAGAVGVAIGRSAVKPIDDLTAAAERVAATQRLEERIAVDRDDEVGRLAAAFNAMLAALEDSRMRQRRLVRDAGHELRTPLTALRMNIEMLARNQDLDPEERRQLLAAAVEEVIALSGLVAEVVGLAGEEGAEEPRRSVDLNEAVADAVSRCRRRSGRTVRVTGGGGTVTAAPGAIGRALDNLLDNAVKWSPVDTPVEVMLSPGRVAVRDHGPGIAEEDRPRVFDRFYRADAARALPGSGLGLAIVDQIVTDHGGSVFVEEAPGGGAVVGFELPIPPVARA